MSTRSIVPTAPASPGGLSAVVSSLASVAAALGVDVTAHRDAWVAGDHVSVGPLISSLGSAIAGQDDLLTALAASRAPVPHLRSVATAGPDQDLDLEPATDDLVPEDLVSDRIQDAWESVTRMRRQVWARQSEVMPIGFDPAEPRDAGERRARVAGRAAGLGQVAGLLAPLHESCRPVADVCEHLARLRATLAACSIDRAESLTPRREWWYEQGRAEAAAQAVSLLEATGRVRVVA